MINKVTLIGNAGMKPEIKNFENGGRIARLNIATKERIFNRKTEEWQDHTEWHTLIFSGNLVKVVEEYVATGSLIYIEGKLRTRQWTDNNNIKHYSTVIYVDELRLLNRKQAQQEQQEQQEQQAQQKQEQVPVNVPEQMPINDEDDLPF